jgi:hypothetical protein
VEIRDALLDVNNPSGGGNASAVVPNQDKSPGFKLFDLNQANASGLEEQMNNWTKDGDINDNQPEILIDYIDQSPGVPSPACSTAPRDGVVPAVPYQFRKVPPTSTTSSFYACVDTDKTIAQVFIRGNALARIQPKQNPPAYVSSRNAYFPRASIQVQGRGLVSLTPGGS